jgi:hypothetical protein
MNGVGYTSLFLAHENIVFIQTDGVDGTNDPVWRLALKDVKIWDASSSAYLQTLEGCDGSVSSDDVVSIFASLHLFYNLQSAVKGSSYFLHTSTSITTTFLSLYPSPNLHMPQKSPFKTSSHLTLRLASNIPIQIKISHIQNSIIS